MLKLSKFRDYAKDTSGQFSILFALSASALMLGSAVAIDAAAMQKTRSDLHQIADSAALAGASAAEMSNSQRLDVVEAYIQANSGPDLYAAIEGQPVIQFDDTEKEVTVTFQVKSKTLFSKVLGQRNTPVNTKSVASYAQARVKPVSISFALDVSGSMGWAASDGQIKLDALKDSVTLMFQDIASQVDDPSQLTNTMRTGMSAYNTSLQTSELMVPGWQNVNLAVNDLVAGGGTNSTPSMQFAYNQIMQDRTFRTQNGTAENVKEFVIFMTDGENNQTAWDTSTLNICDQMKNQNIEVFTVAFASGTRGQALLQSCATQEDGHYFNAANGAAFRDAFKEIGQEIVEKGVRIKS